MDAGLGINELAGDADTISCVPHSALKHVAHAEFARDPLHVDSYGFIDKGGITRDDEEPLDARQAGDDVLHDAVSKVLLLGIATHVLERQHRYGGRSGRGSAARPLDGYAELQKGRCCFTNTPDPHRFGNILESLCPHILKGALNLAPNLPVSIVGNANPTRFCDPFETHCNIDPITKDIIICDDNITDMNADAKFDPFVLRHIGILFRHAALDFVGASHGVDHAGELNESAVPGILDDTSVMLSDFGIKKRLSKSFQLRQRAFFVDPYQAARARDIRRQNSRQSPLYVLAAQDAPPAREIGCPS